MVIRCILAIRHITLCGRLPGSSIPSSRHGITRSSHLHKTSASILPSSPDDTQPHFQPPDGVTNFNTQWGGVVYQQYFGVLSPVLWTYQGLSTVTSGHYCVYSSLSPTPRSAIVFRCTFTQVLDPTRTVLSHPCNNHRINVPGVVTLQFRSVSVAQW